MKYSFNPAERFGIFKAFDYCCYWCKMPVDWRGLAIDHVVPESLLEKPDQLRDVLDFYGLPKEFPLNDFENWVPSHPSCNCTKNDDIFQQSPAMTAVFTEVKKKAKLARETARSLASNWHFARLDTIISTAAEQRKYTPEAVLELIDSLKNIYADLTKPEQPLDFQLDDMVIVTESQKGIQVRLVEAQEAVPLHIEHRIIVTENGKIVRDSANE